MAGVESAVSTNLRFCRICHEEQVLPGGDAAPLANKAEETKQQLLRTWSFILVRGFVQFTRRVHCGALRLLLKLVRQLRRLRRKLGFGATCGEVEAKDELRPYEKEALDDVRGTVENSPQVDMESLSDPKTLIAPCRCTGTLKYVHQGCLRKWLRRQPDPNCWRCEICGLRYASQVQFRPAYEFLFQWPLRRDKSAGSDFDDAAEDDWFVASSDWDAPSLQASANNADWEYLAANQENQTPSFMVWILRGWQALTQAQRQDPAIASRWLHWLHIIYIGLFSRHIFRQGQELAHLVKQTAALEPLSRALYRGSHAVRSVVEANALVALRTALIAHYLIFLAVDVRFLYRQFKLWRSATARILILNYTESEAPSRG
jgi:hypothetical protein